MPFNGFVNSFTNSPIQPSEVSYLSVDFDTSPGAVVLEWAFQNPASLYPFSQFIQISGSDAGTFSITLPNAIYSSTVQSTIIYNQNTSAVSILNSSGDVIGSAAPSIAYFVGSTDNTTADGEWVFLTLAAGTSSVIASSLVDLTLNPGTPSGSLNEPNAGGLKAYSTYLKMNQSIFPYAGTAYVGNQSDLGNIVTWTEGSGTYTLALANSVSNGFITGIQNRSTLGGIITLTPQGGDLINGSSVAIQMQVNESTYLVSDGGVNWYTFAYSSNTAYVIQNIGYNLGSSIGTITVPISDGSYQIQTFSGSYGSPGYPTINVLLPATLTQQYFINNLSTTNSILVYINGETLDQYKYLVLPGNRLTTFTDGTNLYNAPNFLSDAYVYLSDGTAPLPSMTFANDKTTGIYRDDPTDAMCVSQGATLVASFANTGIESAVNVEALSYTQGEISIYSLARAYG
jgi:hypothetical protein